MLQRLAVPVRPGKTDGAPRPGGKAWLGVCWSLTEVVLTVSTSGRQDRPRRRQDRPRRRQDRPRRTPMSSSHRTSRLRHTKHRKGGEDVAVFLEALVREFGSCSSHGGLLTLLACLRRTHGSSWRAWWSSRGT